VTVITSVAGARKEVYPCGGIQYVGDGADGDRGEERTTSEQAGGEEKGVQQRGGGGGG
jgi:hypothetical protein